MANPRIVRVLNKSLIIAIAITIISFIIPLVPCQTAAVVAEPVYEWGLCRLPNPFTQELVGISTEYYGSNTNPLAGFIIHFLVVYAIITTILLLIRKKAGKILDLTNKKK
jgi:hypothetical protein|tara:strand:+ start:157 stop:486 length:330 start_codon:yes stop_codon:yes gene_type:complete